MELPQPRPFGTEGTGRKTTHDFLSLYSAAHKDHTSTQGGFLKTHDFLGKNGTREHEVVEMRDVERPPPETPVSSVEHILPGGVGTYSITCFNQRIPISKPPEGNVFLMAQANSNSRNDETSNSTSYSGSVFTLWDESNVKKGKTGKENNSSDIAPAGEAGANQGEGQWTTSVERPSQLSSNHKQNASIFSSLSSTQPSSAHRNQSFMDMITSGRSNQEDDDEEDEEFIIKKEPSPYPKVKVDGKNVDQKANTPRSKHSATEQRRRSKINDRFQKLREIIPHGDQKRDKASFLLEVIEYIQCLQERVQKHEDAYQGWSQESSKILPWINHRSSEDLTNQNQPNIVSGTPILLGSKYDETKTGKSAGLPINGQHLVVPDICNAVNLREKVGKLEAMTTAESGPRPQQPNHYSPVGASSIPLPLPEYDVDKMACQSHPHPQVWSNVSGAVTDKLKDREVSIESGTISISTRYSQGLLNTLTAALQSSGVDLTQASISVQIDLGEKANGIVNSSASVVKDIDIPTSNLAILPTIPSSKCKVEECSQAAKRLKTSRSYHA